MKYAALKRFLGGQSQDRLGMSFADIERVLETPLPASAYRRAAWWANDATGHAQAKAWLEAGFKTEQVNIEGKSVTFARISSVQRGVREMQEPYQAGAPVKKHPMAGALKGTFKIAPGWDLTRPALDEDELAEWEANLDRKADIIERGLRGKR